jgi:hypothetical protein
MEGLGGLVEPALPRLKMAVVGRTCEVMSAEVAPSALEVWGDSGCGPSRRLTSNTRHQMVVGVLVPDPVRVTHVEDPVESRCLAHRDPEAATPVLGPALFAADPVHLQTPATAATRHDALDSCPRLYQARRR